MVTLNIKKLTDSATAPAYKRDGDAALDLYADQSVIVLPQQRAMVNTGIAMMIPEGYVGLIWDRSGLAANDGLHCLAGVIDPNYRGEVKVVIINLSSDAYEVKQGDRIAQLLVQPAAHVAVTEVNALEDSSRGQEGFGSSGR